LEQFKRFRIKYGSHKASYNIIYQLLHWRKETALIFTRKSQKFLENQFLRTSDNFYHSGVIKTLLQTVPTALYNRSKTPNFLSIVNLNIGSRISVIDKPRRQVRQQGQITLIRTTEVRVELDHFLVQRRRNKLSHVLHRMFLACPLLYERPCSLWQLYPRRAVVPCRGVDEGSRRTTEPRLTVGWIGGANARRASTSSLRIPNSTSPGGGGVSRQPR